LNTWLALLIIVSKLGSPVSNNIHVTLSYFLYLKNNLAHLCLPRKNLRGLLVQDVLLTGSPSNSVKALKGY